MRLVIFTFIVISLSIIVSERKHEEDSDEFDRRYIDLTGLVRRQFGLEAALMHPGNVICSPAALMIPLGKLAVGAQKKTERELLKSLGLKSRKQIKRTMKQLITHLAQVPGCKLDVASRIFVSRENDVKLTKKFEKRSHDIFKASVGWIKPSDPNRAVREINDWIAGRMRHKIKEIKSLDLTQGTTLVLVSVAYFSGTWLHRFNKINNDSFWLASGTSQVMEMMSKRGRYHYLNSTILKSKIIELPYAGKDSSMILVLPDQTNGFEDVLKTLKIAPELLNDALSQMKYEDVLVTMPKFYIESEFDLKSLFRKVHICSIFNRTLSNLNGIINNENVSVTKAIHKAVIEVNEKGNDASPGDVVMNQLSHVIPMEFNANRPFVFYVIAHQEQLFSGVFRGTVEELT